MKEKYLVINAGSSSLKFSLYEMPEEIELVNGYVEKIGLPDSFWQIKYNGQKERKNAIIENYNDAVEVMLSVLLEKKLISSLDEISGIGHRILHGGEIYSDSVLIDDKVISDIEDLTVFGPLHHPGELAGIRAMQNVLPNTPQVAVFDTAFHQTMPIENYMYAIPYEYYEKYNVRRYGFHGTSYKYLTGVMKKKLNKEDVNLIICHVGSGASICCIKNGLSYDTSMGLTPLDGLIMGTRSGEIDPAIIKYIITKEGLSINQMDSILNKKSGLLGICGESDFRNLLKLREQGDEKAQLAYSMYKDAIVKHIAEYYFELKGKLDAIVFTAGVLENSAMIRRDILSEIKDTMGIIINEGKNTMVGGLNELKEAIITNENSRYPVYVIPTDENLMIIRDTYNIVNSHTYTLLH